MGFFVYLLYFRIWSHSDSVAKAAETQAGKQTQTLRKWVSEWWQREKERKTGKEGGEGQGERGERKSCR